MLSICWGKLSSAFTAPTPHTGGRTKETKCLRCCLPLWHSTSPCCVRGARGEAFRSTTREQTVRHFPICFAIWTPIMMANTTRHVTGSNRLKSLDGVGEELRPWNWQIESRTVANSKESTLKL